MGSEYEPQYILKLVLAKKTSKNYKGIAFYYLRNWAWCGSLRNIPQSLMSHATHQYSVLPLPTLLTQNTLALWSCFLLRRWKLAYTISFCKSWHCAVWGTLGLALCVPAHLCTSQTILKLSEFWMTAYHFFSHVNSVYYHVIQNWSIQ
jgi:hypothetical protein